MITGRHRPRSTRDRLQDEAVVWLSAGGLGLCLLMLASLLGLIAWEGTSVFWPRNVMEIQLTEPVQVNGLETSVLSGMLVKEQENPKQGFTEWQLFTGNKEITNAPFRYLRKDRIADISFPEDIVVAERLEYGRAIFYPTALTTTAGVRITKHAPAFWESFDENIRTVRERFEHITRLEKSQLGALNRQIDEWQNKQAFLLNRQASGEPVQQRRLDRIENRLEVLKIEFEAVVEELNRLRLMQEQGSIAYRLSSGETGSMPLGDILHVHRPNEMGWIRKAVLIGERIERFLTERPREANTEGGIFPAIFGTFVMTVLMSAAVMPFGVLTAIYMHEYAQQGLFVRTVRISVNNLAGVPSIVFGVFGLGFFIYVLGGSIDQLFFSDKLPTATFGTGGIFWASLTLAFMTVPVVIVSTEEALSAVPREIREASLASGATKWQTLWHVVLPASAPGMLTGLILAMARGAGEVAPLMLVGVVKLAPSLPVDGVFPFIHLDRKFMHLGYHIYDLAFQSPDSEAVRPTVFATTLLLILLVIMLNLGAILLRNHLRHRYRTSTF